jgi:hypothetical protein
MVFTMESAQHPPSTSTSHTPVPRVPSSSVTSLGLSVMPAPAAGALGIFNIQPLPPHLPSCSPSISKFNYINRFSFKQLRIFLLSSSSTHIYTTTNPHLNPSNSHRFGHCCLLIRLDIKTDGTGQTDTETIENKSSIPIVIWVI